MTELASWDDVLAHLRSRQFRVSPRGAIARIEVIHDGTTVEVLAGVIPFVSGSTWLALSVGVCPYQQLHFRAALVANMELDIGAFALSEHYVVLRQSVPLHGLRPEQLVDTMTALVARAQSLRAATALSDDRYTELPYAYCFRSA
jgi:hypothetical protein